MSPAETKAVKRPVNLTLKRDLVERARAEGPNISALAKTALSTALAQRPREKLAVDIAQACRMHELYLDKYGSLAEAVRADSDADS